MTLEIDDREQNSISNNFLREGHFLLTPLQVFLINKKMPKGFKLELEENLVKYMETTKPPPKKNKTNAQPRKDSITKEDDLKSESNKNKKKQKKNDLSDIVSKDDNSSLSNANAASKRSVREKKPTSFDDLGYIDKDKIKGSKNVLLLDVFKKCEKGLFKLKKHPLAEYYMTSSSADIPSISQVEKNLKAYNYRSIFQFTLDLRKIWNYYFSHFSSTPEVYQRTCKISEFSEEIINDLDTVHEDKSEIHELSKKLDKLTREMKEIQGKNTTVPNVVKSKGDKNTSFMDKPMTINEKNSLGNNIRSLNPDQLKGIVNILSDSMVIDPKSKFFEFDIETLNTRKLRELEKYVKGCLKNKGTNAYKPPENKVKKPLTGKEISENAKIEQLKEDLRIPPTNNTQIQRQQMQETTNNQANKNLLNNVGMGSDKKPTIKKTEETLNKKHILSDSDSLSSSEDSDSESLSSLDFKKTNN